MLFTLTLLRSQGKRLSDPSLRVNFACIESSNKSGFLCFKATPRGLEDGTKVPNLFEPRILKMNSKLIHLMGFEMTDGASFVQEWVLQNPIRRSPREESTKNPIATANRLKAT